MSDAIPVGDVLGDLAFVPLPEGWSARQACLLIKCTDEDGDPAWAIRTSEDMMDEELLGVMTVRVDMLRKALAEAYVDPEYDLDADAE